MNPPTTDPPGANKETAATVARQKTIRSDASLQGKGLFTGQPCRMRLRPSGPDSGIVFVRSDLSEPVTIPSDIGHLTKRARRTSLTNGSAGVETIEHVLSAVVGMDVDNVRIEVDAGETPSTDGSPWPFVEAIQSAGVQEQSADRKVFVVPEPVSVTEGDRMLAALPGPDDCLEIFYEMDYSPVAPSIGRQVYTFRLGLDDYVTQIAPARTFLLEAEAEEMRKRGYGKHLTAKDVVVWSDSGPLEGNKLRFPDEGVRHKICDLIGDLALLGRPLRGRIVACKAGHDLNHALVRKLTDQLAESEQSEALVAEPEMDIYRIMRLLPHRYPFLMVDRIVEIEGDRRAVGVKNVSINEPFFQGHYPNLPVMPGVLILEALAQVSGILLSRRLEHTGRVAFLVSMDRVKIRRQVRPGDQLVLKAEALHVRTRTGHCRCQAFVGQELAAEAEIKFMLVDAERSVT